jgi:hypothetical protein
MKVEEGKFYTLRNGSRVGPMTWRGGMMEDFVEPAMRNWWRVDGRVGGYGTENNPLDIVAEGEPTGPVRTVTRKEIVPGIYGKLNVTGTYQKSRVTLDWVTDDFYTAPPIVGLDASELRAAAATLTEIADALESQTP